MTFTRDLLALLGFRTRALRRLAARKSIVGGWVVLGLGFVVFAWIRSSVFSDIELGAAGRPRGGFFALVLDLNLIQSLLFLSVVYVPGLISLSNAFSGDGLGFSLSHEEYRIHISVLFPMWGCLFLIAAVLQLLIPGFLAIGFLEVSVGLTVLAGLMVAYTVWAIKQINYLPALTAIAVFVLSWFTLPIFWILTMFLLALPFFLLIPVLFIAWHRLRGFMVSRSGERAFQEHFRSLTVNPQDADAHYQLGLMHLKKGNHQTARTYFENAMNIDPRDPDYQYYLGRVFEEQEDWPAALERYEETYRLNPEYGLGDISREVGKGYLHCGQVEKAVEFLRFFLTTRGSDPEGRYWLAVAFQKQGEKEEMERELRTILEQARSNPRFFRKENRSWLYRARVLLRQTTKPGS